MHIDWNVVAAFGIGFMMGVSMAFRIATKKVKSLLLEEQEQSRP